MKIRSWSEREPNLVFLTAAGGGLTASVAKCLQLTVVVDVAVVVIALMG